MQTSSTIKDFLAQNYDLSEISAQIIPLDTYNQDGQPVLIRNLVVLDKDDKFMFTINHPLSEQYIDEDGWINYEMIYLNIMTSTTSEE